VTNPAQRSFGWLDVAGRTQRLGPAARQLRGARRRRRDPHRRHPGAPILALGPGGGGRRLAARRADAGPAGESSRGATFHPELPADVARVTAA
jgi:hypothetical protein